MKKKHIILICFFISLLFLSACNKNIFNETSDIITETKETKKCLDKPSNLKYDSSSYKISWDKVSGAVGYEIFYNGDTIITEENEIDILDLFETENNYYVTICALSIDENRNSDFSDEIKVNIKPTDNLQYVLLEDGSGYGVSRGEINFFQMPETIIIPDRYNGLPVTETLEYSFTYKGLPLKPGVQYINETTKRIRLPHELKKLGKMSFGFLKKLEQIEFPESLEVIGEGTFSNCSKLKNINLPKNIKSIEGSAFVGTGIEEFNLPNITLGTQIFYRCNNLKKLVFADGIKEVPSRICEKAINLKEVILPNTIEKINHGAFIDCINLELIEIPNSVSYIDDYAFYNCEKLENLNLSDELSYISKLSIEGTKWLANKNGLVEVAGFLLTYNNMPENYELIIPEDIHTISKESFLNEENLISLTIPSTVRNIEKSAFSGCKSLKKVSIEAEIDIINDNLFNGCISLGVVKLPETIRIIGMSAFGKCSSLEIINVPKALEEIGNFAFYGCGSLKEFDFTNIKKLGMNSFSNVGIEYLIVDHDFLNNEIKSINLTTVIIGKNVTNMPLFNNCTSLKEVFYEGTEEEYQNILRDNYESSGNNNGVLLATIYYYYEEKPTIDGNFWHYVEGKPVIW